MATHYQMLGIKPDAASDDVRAAYRRLIRKFHPDVIGPAGEDKTRLLNEAQRILSDPALRSEYDRSIRPPTLPSAPPPKAPPTTPPPRDSTGDGYMRPSARVNFTPGPEYEAEQERIAQWSHSRFRSWRNTWLISLAVLLASAVPPILFFFNSFSSLRPLPAVFAVIIVAAAFSPQINRFAAFLGVLGMLLWPLAEFGVWPAAGLLVDIPVGYLASITVLGLATIVYRFSAGPVKELWHSRPFKDRAPI